MKTTSRLIFRCFFGAIIVLTILGTSPAKAYGIFSYSPTFTYWNITYPKSILGAVCPGCGYGYNLYRANTPNRNYLDSLSSSRMYTSSVGYPGSIFSDVNRLMSINVLGVYGNNF